MKPFELRRIPAPVVASHGVSRKSPGSFIERFDTRAEAEVYLLEKGYNFRPTTDEIGGYYIDTHGNAFFIIDLTKKSDLPELPVKELKPPIQPKATSKLSRKLTKF